MEDQAGDGVPEISAQGELSSEELKVQGNIAFKRAQLLQKTTAAKQYLAEAKAHYIQAIQKLSSAKADAKNLSLVCTLHSNLCAVYLLETPPKWNEAKAAADIALTVEPKHVKSLFRRAQALLQDNREGLPEEALSEALQSLKAAQALEPANEAISRETERIARRLAVLEAKRAVPKPAEIVKGVNSMLLDRGGDCLTEHGYVWGQTETLVHIFIPTIKLRLAKPDITVVVKSRNLRIEVSSGEETGDSRFEMDRPLHKSVVPDECNWQVDEGGLYLHVELAKKDASSEGEHWKRVWDGHAQTMAPSAEERKQLKDMARSAREAEEEEGPQVLDTSQEDKLKRWKELLPGVNVEWGDTSTDSISSHREAMLGGYG